MYLAMNASFLEKESRS